MGGEDAAVLAAKAMPTSPTAQQTRPSASLVLVTTRGTADGLSEPSVVAGRRCARLAQGRSATPKSAGEVASLAAELAGCVCPRAPIFDPSQAGVGAGRLACVLVRPSVAAAVLNRRADYT